MKDNGVEDEMIESCYINGDGNEVVFVVRYGNCFVYFLR